MGIAEGSKRNIICVDGDGGFQFNIQELETIASLKLPVKFFVLNNEGYGSIRASQTAFFGACSIGCDAATGQTLPDVRRVAEAYGIATDIITNQRNLADEIRRVLATPGPVVCDVRIVLDEVRQPGFRLLNGPMALCLQTPRRPLAFLDREEFKANMLIPVIKERRTRMPHLAVMQGRLVPPEDGRFQSFPRGRWRDEFALAAQAGLNAIQWIFEYTAKTQTPLSTMQASPKCMPFPRKRASRYARFAPITSWTGPFCVPLNRKGTNW